MLLYFVGNVVGNRYMYEEVVVRPFHILSFCYQVILNGDDFLFVFSGQ